MKIKFVSKVIMFQHALEFKVVIHVCYNQQTLALQGKIPTSQVWAIVEVIASTLALVVSSCVLNQHCGYWLLSDALANAINLCVKLTQKRLQLEIQMNPILAYQFDVKLFLLTSRMRLEVNHVLVPFLDYLHEFDPKKAHMMLALMFDPKFKDLSIVNNYVKRNMAIIVTTRCDSKTLMPLLCSTYWKVNVFVEPTKKFVTQELPLAMFGVGLSPNDIAIEHVSFYIHNCWFMHSK
jgi:hypothetical protein